MATSRTQEQIEGARESIIPGSPCAGKALGREQVLQVLEHAEEIEGQPRLMSVRDNELH